jgi:glycosyltransferase involved in cell wall biosynthesis
VLLAAFTTLPPELRERVELTFIGRPLRKDFTAALVSAADGLPNVHFAGALDPAACLGQLRRAEIFVLSSADEVLPVSMLEAMAFGKAVVTTDVGGITEAIEPGVNGLVVPAGDPDRLAAALAMLIEDAALRARLGQRAQATFRERYTGEQFARGFLPIVEQALADPRPAPPAAEPLRGSV